MEDMRLETSSCSILSLHFLCSSRFPDSLSWGPKRQAHPQYVAFFEMGDQEEAPSRRALWESEDAPKARWRFPGTSSGKNVPLPGTTGYSPVPRMRRVSSQSHDSTFSKIFTECLPCARLTPSITAGHLHAMQEIDEVPSPATHTTGPCQPARGDQPIHTEVLMADRAAATSAC